MTFIEKKEATAVARIKQKSGKAAAGMAAAVLAGGAAFASNANAANLVEGVVSYIINADNSLTATYVDGSQMTYAAGRYIVEAGKLMQVDLGGMPDLALGGVLGGGVAAVALSPEIINGIDGQDGADGINGVDGQDGADGEDGEDGEDGADGRDWNDGDDDGDDDDDDSDIGPDFEDDEDIITNASGELEFGDLEVRSVELEGGGDNIDLIDIDNVYDDDDLTIENLGDGDRVEISNSDPINNLTLDPHDSDGSIIVSLEGLTINEVLEVGKASEVSIEASGSSESSIAALDLNDDAKTLKLEGEQRLSIIEFSKEDGLEQVDASGSNAGITIGDFDGTTLLSDGATGLRDLNDFDGSDFNDVLAVDNIGDDADINLGEGDDVLILQDDGLEGSILIFAGLGADTVDVSEAQADDETTLTIDLGSDTDEDTLILGDDSANLNSDSEDDNFAVIQNFIVGTDKLVIQGVASDGVATSASGDLDNGVNIHTDALSSDIDLTDAEAVSEALASVYNYDNDGESTYVLVNNGTDSALYFFEDDDDSGLADDGDEASLVAIFEDVPDMSSLAVSHVEFIGAD